MLFEDLYVREGKCDVCGKETDIVVCASSMGPISYGYCKECLEKGLEPYDAMVTYIALAGRFPDEINPSYQSYCRDILKGLGISENQFINDVDKAINELYKYSDNSDELPIFEIDE